MPKKDGKFHVTLECEHGFTFKAPVHLVGVGYLEDSCPLADVEEIFAAALAPERKPTLRERVRAWRSK